MYNTHLNIIAGIPDISLVLEVLSHSKDEKKIVVPNRDISDLCNRYGIRTQKAMIRFIQAIDKSFNIYQNSNHRQTFLSLIQNPDLTSVQNLLLFFQMAINNELFRDLTTEVYCRQYFAVKATFKVNDVSDYIDNIKEKHDVLNKWSVSTINIIASKYLTLLKKFNLLEGKARKAIKSVMLSNLAMICLVYLVKSLNEDTLNFFENQYFPLFLMSRELFLKQVKNIAKSDYFTVTTLGYDLRVDLKYSFQEITDVLSQNYRSKI